MTETKPAGASDHPAVARYARHVSPAFVKLLGMLGYGRLFVRALDVWLWDHEGRRYLDLLADFGAANLGHNPPRLARRLQEHLASESPALAHVSPSIPAGELAEALALRTGGALERVLFSSSGAEAVEAGVKLARAATGRAGFAFCQGGFHGTNLGALSFLGSERLRRSFEPLLAYGQEVPFGDLDALDAALRLRRSAAFIVEPIQAEGGIVIPPEGYLAAAQEICRRTGTALVLDEVQTGLGRTGTLFAYEAEGFVPDILVIGKALGGGLTPVSATLTRPELHDRAYGSMDRFDLHISTFAGNALGAVSALETLRVIDDEGLVGRSAERGRTLLSALRSRLAAHPLVREVRGRGLLVGIELGPTGQGIAGRVAPGLVESVSRNVFGQWAALRLLERGIVCQPASQRWEVLRIEPPLTIAPAEIDEAVDAVASVLEDYRGIAALAKDVTARLGSQFLKGWAF